MMQKSLECDYQYVTEYSYFITLVATIYVDF